MKKKTLLVFLLITLFSVIAATQVFAASDSVVGTPDSLQIIGGKEFFFANGTPITIEERTDGNPGALIKWNGGEQLVGEESNIFGGMHDNGATVDTSVIMNGGAVKYIFGGGLHKSNTVNAKVVMNGGRVNQIDGAGASDWTTDCDCTDENTSWKDGDYKNAPCQTKNALVVINGGTICGSRFGLLFGGGCGYSNTEKATIEINGGDLSATYVTAGGSNGNTKEASIVINGGTIGTVQSVNRGTMEEVSVTVSGGKIENLYVGGETGDATVTGTITGKVAVKVSGKASVKQLEAGKNGGVVVDPTTDTVIKTENIVVVAGTVETLHNTNFTSVNRVTIDGVEYLVKPFTTIKDIPTYAEFTKKEGYKFIGFKTATGETWDEATEIDDNYELTTIFEKIEEPVANVEKNEEDEKDNTPKTGGEINTLNLIAVLVVISLAGLVLIRKSK